MFAAGQSTQVAQEDQQSIIALTPGVRKFKRLIRQILQDQRWGWISRFIEI